MFKVRHTSGRETICHNLRQVNLASSLGGELFTYTAMEEWVRCWITRPNGTYYGTLPNQDIKETVNFAPGVGRLHQLLASCSQSDATEE